MANNFKDKYGPCAIVTGASSGIGEAFAHAVAERGVKPLLVARREDELRRVASEVKAKTGIECDIIALDLASADFIDKLTDYCADRDIGLVVSNAGYNPLGSFADMSRETMLQILDVNDRAPLLLANAFLSQLTARGRGGFLLVGSMEGFSGSPWSSVYSASKAFVQSLGEALWGEYQEKGVDVLVLAPGATDTPLLASRNMAGAPGSMSAESVANYGLDRLPHGPGAIPGRSNRIMAGVLRRLPRKLVVNLTGKGIKRMLDRMEQ